MPKAKPKPTHSLNSADQKKEMEITTFCWSQIQLLDTSARFRVIRWLSSWARAEAPDNSSDFDGIPF